MIEAITAVAARPRQMDEAPTVPFGYEVVSYCPTEASHGALTAKGATSDLCRASHRLSEAMRQRHGLLSMAALGITSMEKA